MRMDCHGGVTLGVWPASYSSQSALAAKTENTMPQGAPGICGASCAADIAAYLLSEKQSIWKTENGKRKTENGKRGL